MWKDVRLKLLRFLRVLRNWLRQHFVGGGLILFALWTLKSYVGLQRRRKVVRLAAEDQDNRESGFTDFEDYESDETENTEGTESSDNRIEEEFFEMSKLLSALGKDVFKTLSPQLQRISVPLGYALFSPGECITRGMYVIFRGTFGVFTGMGSLGEEPHYELKCGDEICSYGLTLPQGTTTGMSCIALEPSEIYFLSRQVFETFIKDNPSEFDPFLRIVIARRWRIARFVLEEFIGLPKASRAEVQGGNEVAKLKVIPNIPLRVKSENATSRSEYRVSTQKTPQATFDVISLKPGEALFYMGDEVDEFYIIYSGELVSVVEQPDGTSVEIARICSSCVVGGMSFFSETCRGETIKAATHTTLLACSSASYPEILAKMPREILPAIQAVGRQLSMFCHQFFELGLHSTWHRGGDVILSENDGLKNLFLVIGGRVKIIMGRTKPRKTFKRSAQHREMLNQTNSPKSSNKRSFVTFHVGRGETLGESRIFSDTSDVSSVIAVSERDSELVSISSTTLRSIMKRFPSSVLRFTEMVARRLTRLTAETLQQNEARSAKNLCTIALLRAGKTRQVDVDSVALKLHAALSQFGKTLLLSSQRLQTIFGHDMNLSLRNYSELVKMSLWLSKQEEDSRFLIFCTDSGPNVSAWDRLCMRQADCILLIGRNGYDFRVSKYEAKLLDLARRDRNPALSFPSHMNINAPTHLVLLHAAATPLPRNTRKWLGCRPKVEHWHHVRLSVDRDIRRLARRLAHCSVGLVLGGGGSKGLAHLGVLKALHERKIEVDCIGGTSQGAFMAALYALSLDLRQMEHWARVFSGSFTAWNMLKELTLPILSYFDGKHFSRVVRKCLGDSAIEDLWIPFFCVSTNLGTNNQFEHKTGRLWLFVRASMTVLGYIPPVIYKGIALVDGGYVNNLPVDVMNSTWSPSVVIAVDVEDKDQTAMTDLYNYGYGVSGWWLLLQRLNFFNRAKVPAWGDILVWLNCISHNRQLQLLDDESIDVYIRPKAQNFHLLDYHKMDEIVQKGYEAGIEAIDAFLLEEEAQKLYVNENSMPRIQSFSGMSMLNRTRNRAESNTIPYSAHSSDRTTPLVRHNSAPALNRMMIQRALMADPSMTLSSSD